jgi:hypothetical protein
MKFCLCIVEYHCMKKYEGVPRIPTSFLRGKSLSYPLVRRLGGPRAGMNMTASTAVLVHRSPFFQPLASHCTDWAIHVQWTLELRTVSCSNNLKVQKIRGKSGFETRTKNHVVAFSLCLNARAVDRLVLPWLVQRASWKLSVFKRFVYCFRLFLYYLQ